MRAHVGGNMSALADIPASPGDLSPLRSQPWRIQDSGGSDPPQADSGGG
jgi:hypothetical protein